MRSGYNSFVANGPVNDRVVASSIEELLMVEFHHLLTVN